MLTKSATPDLVLVTAPDDRLNDRFSGGVDRVWRVSLCLLGMQLIGMLVFTTVQYQRFNLTNDFAGYAQAWTAIAHGHMSPFSSVLTVPFWRNDFELLMWPLALFYWVYPHAVTLLWLQVFAVVGGELVALSWAREAVRRRPQDKGLAPVLLGLVAALLLLTPWSWYTIGFDFHFVPFAALFALLAARDLWAGRYRRGLVVWVPFTLLSAAAGGALLVIAVGLAGLLSRNASRRVALAFVALGLGWLVLASGLSAMRFEGLQLSSMYGYLANHQSGPFGLTDVVEGLVSNPMAALNMFISHLRYVLGYIASAGVIGLYSRWGLIITTAVLLPSALNANPNFIHFAQAFQSWPAVLFLIAAYVLALHRVAGNAPLSRHVVYTFGTITIALAVTITALFAGQIPGYIARVSPAAAGELSALETKIPPDAEVIASQGVIGRFGAGRVAFSYWAYGRRETYAITARPVVFILAPVQGTAEGLPSETRRAIQYVGRSLAAKVLVHGHGIWVYSWMPEPGTTRVALP
jgi:hypothetical protein